MKKINFYRSVWTVVLFLTVIILSSMLTSCQKKDYHGFKLIEKRFVKEINSECLFFEHEKSGATLMKIQNDDPNKTFSITFRTFPVSDDGSPHIMEHSVLNGSKNFPVKSPFDVLSKGSLSTFINAFTSKDYTMFPIASMNEKDYFNLMHVYLDAVFNPLLYSDPRILKQEGWHYELTGNESPVVYKGVVYNEMKGAFSNPQRELIYQVYKNLFPDSPYGFESGGYPSAIPNLTQEAFIDYHKRYYHPENSYIFLYGDGDLEKELAFIDKEYLSKYEKTNTKPAIEDQKSFTARKEVTAFYPVIDGTKLENQTYLTLNWVAGHNTDQALSMALDVLCEVLVNQESAPIRLALQKAGIGQDVSANASNYKQNVVQITVQNANPKDKQHFLDIVTSNLKEIVAKGLDKKEVEGVINRREFQLREGEDAQKGLTYLRQALPGWFFMNDPFIGLEYEKPLAEVKTALTTNYLESIIQKYFIDNPHSLIVTLEPKPGLDKERNTVVEQELKAYKASLDPSSIASLEKETKELIEYQKREDTPEALASIPMLGIKDINPKSVFYSLDEKSVSGTPVLYYEEFTNNVVYVNYFFDLRVLPQELIPYASLLSNVIGILNTENYSYGALNQALNINTGGFYTSLRTYLENQDDKTMVPKFVVTSKVMKDKLDKLFDLSNEILNKTNYSDVERLKTVLIRHQSQLDAQMKGNGYSVASRRLPSYFSNQGVFNELTGGLDYYWFVSNLTLNFDTEQKLIVEKLKRVADLLFTKNNLMASVTCSADDLESFSKGFTTMINAMPQNRPMNNTWMFNPEKKNEGIQAASKVQFVMEGYNFKKLGYSWDGRMKVLSQILSTDWLQTRIRVIGGAYGGWSTFSSNGTVTFNSYRDPNLKETLENYSATVDYLSNFKADEKTMTRYIIGTISGMDDPLTPSQKGEQAVTWYFGKRSPEDVQKDRDAVLATRQEDIRGYAKLIKDILDQKAFCVYGNVDKINSEKGLFINLVKIDR